jgi:hypothetical protein
VRFHRTFVLILAAALSLFIAGVESSRAGLGLHGSIAPPPPLVQTLTPKDAAQGGTWNGTIGSGGAPPGSPTQAVTGTVSDGGLIQLDVADTSAFTTGNIVCAKFVAGTGEANRCWTATVVSGTALDLQGSTWTNAWTAGGIVGIAYGAQAISAVTNAGPSYAPVCLTVPSTQYMATGTLFEVDGIPAAMAGTWNISVKDSSGNYVTGASATSVCLGTSAQPGPAYAAGYTSGGIIAFNEQVTAAMDEESGAVVESQNSEYVYIGAAITNRSWISRVKCYLEGNTITIAAGAQTQSPTRGTGGWGMLVNGPASGLNGDVNLTCDAYPVDGLARRLAINLWINSQPSGSGYVTRPMIYVDSAIGADPAFTAQSTTLSTDATGKVVTFSSAINVPAVVAVYSGSPAMIMAWSTADPTVPGQLNGCSNVTVCTMLTSLGANLSSVAWTNNANCRSGWGTVGSPYKTILWAAACATAGGHVSTGAIIKATNGQTFTDPANAPCVNGGTCIGSATVANAHMVEVRPKTDPTAITAISWASGTVTVTAQNAYTNGEQVLVEGMFPSEFNGPVTVTSASCGSPPCATFTYALAANPYVAHAGVTTIYGQTVQPYTIEVLSSLNWHAQWAQSVQNISYEGALIDFATVGGIKGCSGNGCNIAPLNGAQTSVTWIKNSSYVDSNGALGPAYSYYYGNYFQPLFFSGRNYALSETTLDLQTISGAAFLRNYDGIISATIIITPPPTPVALFHGETHQPMSGGGFVGTSQRLTLEPMDGVTTTPCTATEATVSGPRCMPAINSTPTFDGTNTSFTVQALAGTGTNYLGLFGAFQFVNGCLAGQPATLVNYVASTHTVTIAGDYSSSACIGDGVYISEGAHGDDLEVTIQPSAGVATDYNQYYQRFTHYAFNKPLFTQAGGYLGGSSSSVGSLTSSGTSVSCTGTACATSQSTIQVGDFISVLNGANAHQYRQVTAVAAQTGANAFTIDQPFSPDISTPAVWGQAKPSINIACVACRLGGNAISVGGTSQEVHGSENWAIIQMTMGYDNFWFRNANGTSGGGNGSAFGIKNWAIFDSLIGTSGVSSGVPDSVHGDISWATQASDGTNVTRGYNFDDDNYTYAAAGQTPGTNYGTTNVSLDANYRPISAFTQQALGVQAGIVPNGTPMYPWTGDGVPIISGALVGAMQP